MIGFPMGIVLTIMVISLYMGMEFKLARILRAAVGHHPIMLVWTRDRRIQPIPLDYELGQTGEYEDKKRGTGAVWNLNPKDSGMLCRTECYISTDSKGHSLGVEDLANLELLNNPQIEQAVVKQVNKRVKEEWDNRQKDNPNKLPLPEDLENITSWSEMSKKALEFPVLKHVLDRFQIVNPHTANLGNIAGDKATPTVISTLLRAKKIATYAKIKDVLQGPRTGFFSFNTMMVAIVAFLVIFFALIFLMPPIQKAIGKLIPIGSKIVP